MKSALEVAATESSGGQLNASVFPWEVLRRPHAALLRESLVEGRSARTVARMLSAVRGVLRVCTEAGRISPQDFEGCLEALRVKGGRAHCTRPVDERMVRQLITGCRDGTIGGRRDAVIMVGLFFGLLSSELAALDVSDWDSGSTTLRITRPRSGGAFTRTVRLGASIAEVFVEWLVVRGGARGPLLVHVHRSGRIVDRRLRPRAVRDVLLRRCEQIGLVPLTPRQLRAGALALHARRVGVPAVRILAGHARRATTAWYDETLSPAESVA
ncbi:MAG: site-specific integrase [Deltaproteobacteria bacterium]|nr:site-specific integrase [Deltaproteobacteria bacterium]